MIVTQRQAASAVPGHPAKVAAHALADRLQRLEARRPRGGMNADAGGGAMIDRDKNGGGPFSVQVVVRSVPHIASTASGMMASSCARGSRADPTRVGANNPFCSISAAPSFAFSRLLAGFGLSAAFPQVKRVD